VHLAGGLFRGVSTGITKRVTLATKLGEKAISGSFGFLLQVVVGISSILKLLSTGQPQDKIPVIDMELSDLTVT